MVKQGSTKKTRGRKNIEIKPITEAENRLETFSKHKSEIIKKATELTNVCGAEVGVVINSPAGKPIAFGTPSIEQVTDRVLNTGTVTGPVDRRVRSANLADRHSELKERLRAAYEKNKRLKMISEANQREDAANNVKPAWWKVPVDQAGYAELDSVVRLHEALCNHLGDV